METTAGITGWDLLLSVWLGLISGAMILTAITKWRNIFAGHIQRSRLPARAAATMHELPGWIIWIAFCPAGLLLIVVLTIATKFVLNANIDPAIRFQSLLAVGLFAAILVMPLLNAADDLIVSRRRPFKAIYWLPMTIAMAIVAIAIYGSMTCSEGIAARWWTPCWPLNETA